MQKTEKKWKCFAENCGHKFDQKGVEFDDLICPECGSSKVDWAKDDMIGCKECGCPFYENTDEGFKCINCNTSVK